VSTPETTPAEPARPPAEQRRLLAETIRSVARWRYDKAMEFKDDEIARKRSLRSEQALKRLANFVEALPDDDRDLNLRALGQTDEREGQLTLSRESLDILSRFGMDRGAWTTGPASERQMRNLLRRVDGSETRERHARKQGYGGA
jgi:hypothetical protein